MPDFKSIAARIPCACPLCGCPAAGARGNYTFCYVNGPLVYFDVPKAASTSIRRAFFGPDESMSLRDAPPPGAGFRFTVVRNPFARALSNWRMFTTQPARIRQLRSMGGDPDATFAQFLRFAGTTPNHHWVPQSAYVPRDLDLVGRVETFAADFARIRAAATGFGLTGLAATPPHLNGTGDAGAYADHYDPETRELVARHYAEDLARFDYRF